MVSTNLIGKTVLIIEDDPNIRHLVKIYLQKEGYEVLEAEDGQVGKRMIQQYDPCLVILDLILPEISGEELCHWLREEFESLIPVIMLSAKASEKQRIKGFKLGADDYVVKPFSPAELMVRIEAVLRRTASRCGRISFTGLTVKPVKGEALVNGEILDLTNFEFKLLHMFMQHPEQIFTREQILNHIYDQQEKAVTERTIDVHIKNLRDKLKEKAPKDYIQTVRGMGYKFAPS
ncbi:response regulator transcription factor [Heyndrickxia sp. NPDC080065]|uniref:response regulator transcription factor n=1 Tax=Heyndrickxia sp. NPDC080065 TaxID=3390568 RepID=UPI003D08F6B4